MLCRWFSLWLNRLAVVLSCAALVFAAGCAGTASSGTGPGSKTGSPTLTSIAVSPATAAVAVGATQQLTATGSYSDSSTQNLTSTVTWSSSNSAVATVSAAGLVTAVAAGSATITAADGSVSGTAAITVSQAAPTLSSIAVSPATATLAIAGTQQLAATGSYSDSSTQNLTSTVTWSSSNSAVATVSASGLVTAVAAGSATITAADGSVSGTAAITVSQAAPTLTSVTLAPAATTLSAGATAQLTATANYSDGSTSNVTSSAAWTTSNAGVATVSASGLVTGVAPGAATVTATYNGSSGTAAVTVQATVSSITITPASPSIAVGATQQFTATASYSDGTTGNVTSTATWSTGSASIATISAAGVATGKAAGSTTVTATLNGVTGSTPLTVAAAAPSSIAVTPNPASFSANSTQQFTATATWSGGSTSDVTSLVTWSSSNTSVATIDAGGLATGVASGSTTITAALQGVSGTATANLAAASTSSVSITTWHVDNNRSGLNSQETTLTPSNVTPSTFGKLYSYTFDGYAYGEPLIVSNLTINGAKHNVLFVATEHDDVYAFDADSGSNTPLWHVSLLQSGESPLTDGPIQPFEGVTSTPVIDPSTNTLYVVSEQRNNSTGVGSFRLSALDLATGAQRFGGPVTITASVPGTNTQGGNGTTVTLTTACIQRAALLLANGNIYIGVGSCPTGWLLAYNATTLAQVAVWNASPNLMGEGTYASAGGVWMGGGGPVADSAGNIYIATGNGPWDGKTAFSDSVIKFSPTLQMEDYFTPDSYAYAFCADADLASGGLMLIPGTSELVAGGKIGKLFLVNTNNMGHEQANDAGATQSLWFESDLSSPYADTCNDSSGSHTADINSFEIFGSAAYFNNYVYLGITPTSSTTIAPVREFQYTGGQLIPGAYTSPSQPEDTRGTTPFISSNGSSDGIVWMINQGVPLQQGTPTPAVLYAYDADNFPNQLYNSSDNAADTAGYAIKFSSPVVANGKVYISTGHDPVTAANPDGEIDVYGLK